MTSLTNYLLASNLLYQGFSRSFAILVLLLTATLGTTIGIALPIGFTSAIAISIMVLTGVTLAGILIYSPLLQRRLIAKYRLGEADLIKP